MLGQLLTGSGLRWSRLLGGSRGFTSVFDGGILCGGVFLGLGCVAVGFAVRTNLAFATFFALAFDAGYLTPVGNLENASIVQGVITLRKWDALALVVDNVRLRAFIEVVGIGVNDGAVFEYGFGKVGSWFFAHREVDVETLEHFLHSFGNSHRVAFFV